MYCICMLSFMKLRYSQYDLSITKALRLRVRKTVTILSNAIILLLLNYYNFKDFCTDFKSSEIWLGKVLKYNNKSAPKT